MVFLPTFQTESSRFSQQIILDNILCNVIMEYNIRNGSWYFSLSLPSFPDQVIRRVKVVSRYLLIGNYKYLLPNLSGDFMVIKTNNSSDSDVNYDNLGSSFNLIYLSGNEVSDWKKNVFIG